MRPRLIVHGVEQKTSCQHASPAVETLVPQFLEFVASAASAKSKSSTNLAFLNT